MILTAGRLKSLLHGIPQDAEVWINFTDDESYGFVEKPAVRVESVGVPPVDETGNIKWYFYIEGE